MVVAATGRRAITRRGAPWAESAANRPGPLPERICRPGGVLPGWLVDRYSRTAVVITGGLGMVGALALFAARGSYPLFLVAAALLGLGSGLAGPAPVAGLADALPAEDRTTCVGVYRAIGDVSAALAPLLLG